MTDAHAWLLRCRDIVPEAPSLVDCLILRQILDRAAHHRCPVGVAGWRWAFADGSTLTAHSNQPPRVEIAP